ncbi:hypothetical protein J7L36_02105 [bacterium]|nr:hypothetical protein [bacterium]
MMKRIIKKIVSWSWVKFSSFFTSKSTSSKFTSEVPEEIPHEVVESQQAGEMVLQLVRGERESFSTSEVLNLSPTGRLTLLASLQLALEGVRGNLSPPENEYFKSQSQSPGVRERLQRAIEIVSLYL